MLFYVVEMIIMKNKILSIIDFMLFIGFFLLMLPLLMIQGAILTPIRYFKYVSAKVQDQEAKRYYF